MHHIDLSLFKYQLEFTQKILKQIKRTELQKVFNERLRQVLHFPGLKLFSKFGQLKVMTATDHRQWNVNFLSYIAGGTMQLRFQTAAAFKFFLIITSVTNFCSVFSSCN